MNKTQQIISIYRKEQANGLNVTEAETLRYTALWAREDLGATSSEFADAMETLNVKRGTALNRWSDMKRNMEGLDG
jgi:hypothetical protein